ncbi:hypothetical protein MRX96_032191 [Rhipicephalus microplus]
MRAIKLRAYTNTATAQQNEAPERAAAIAAGRAFNDFNAAVYPFNHGLATPKQRRRPPTGRDELCVLPSSARALGRPKHGAGGQPVISRPAGRKRGRQHFFFRRSRRSAEEGISGIEIRVRSRNVRRGNKSVVAYAKQLLLVRPRGQAITPEAAARAERNPRSRSENKPRKTGVRKYDYLSFSSRLQEEEEGLVRWDLGLD